jgi:UDP-N-acetylglucosamine 2-epimerase (non-hydrolysing)
MRDTTERPEAIEAGVAQLVGTSRTTIVRAVSELLEHPERRAAFSVAENPFGDGKAAKRIVAHLRHALVRESRTAEFAGVAES